MRSVHLFSFRWVFSVAFLLCPKNTAPTKLHICTRRESFFLYQYTHRAFGPTIHWVIGMAKGIFADFMQYPSDTFLHSFKKSQLVNYSWNSNNTPNSNQAHKLA